MGKNLEVRNKIQGGGRVKKMWREKHGNENVSGWKLYGRKIIDGETFRGENYAGGNDVGGESWGWNFSGWKNDAGWKQWDQNEPKGKSWGLILGGQHSFYEFTGGEHSRNQFHTRPNSVLFRAIEIRVFDVRRVEWRFVIFTLERFVVFGN